MMTIRNLLNLGVPQLQQAGVPDPKPDAEWMLSYLLGMSRMEMLLQSVQEVSPETERSFLAMLKKRCERVPLQYLLGTQSFCGLEMDVDSRVLIPRPETEILCEKAIEVLKARDEPAPRVLDLCTGSGAIAVTIKKNIPSAIVYACDLSADALEVAEKNAEKNQTKISFSQGDLFSALPHQTEGFDAILSNPPYIARADCLTLQPEVTCEPMLALQAGEDGLDFYRRIAQSAGKYMNENGFLMMELGEGQGEPVKKILLENHFCELKLQLDLSGKERVISAIRSNHL